MTDLENRSAREVQEGLRRNVAEDIVIGKIVAQTIHYTVEQKSV